MIGWGWVSSEGQLDKVDNTLRDLHNSSDDTKAEFSNVLLFIQNNSQFKEKLKHALTSIFNCLFIGKFRR